MYDMLSSLSKNHRNTAREMRERTRKKK